MLSTNHDWGGIWQLKLAPAAASAADHVGGALTRNRKSSCLLVDVVLLKRQVANKAVQQDTSLARHIFTPILAPGIGARPVYPRLKGGLVMARHELGRPMWDTMLGQARSVHPSSFYVAETLTR